MQSLIQDTNLSSLLLNLNAKRFKFSVPHHRKICKHSNVKGSFFLIHLLAVEKVCFQSFTLGMNEHSKEGWNMKFCAR